MPEVEAIQRTDSLGTHFVLLEGDADKAQISGRWLKTQTPARLEDWQ